MCWSIWGNALLTLSRGHGVRGWLASVTDPRCWDLWRYSGPSGHTASPSPFVYWYLFGEESDTAMMRAWNILGYWYSWVERFSASSRFQRNHEIFIFQSGSPLEPWCLLAHAWVLLLNMVYWFLNLMTFVVLLKMFTHAIHRIIIKK